ncbi:MAG: hypothetical protein HY975_02505 [Candidatus Kerfeldbacteria bacterium]|nr:hypothetical protein [Candidatus Kerfeldbacteria bacterium]
MEETLGLEERFKQLIIGQMRKQVGQPLRSTLGPDWPVEVNFGLARWQRIDRSRYQVCNADAALGFRFDQTGRATVTMTSLTFNEPASMLDAMVEALLRQLTFSVRPETESLLEQYPAIRHGTNLISICGQVTESAGQIGVFYIGANSHEVSLLNYLIETPWPVGYQFIFKKQ